VLEYDKGRAQGIAKAQRADGFRSRWPADVKLTSRFFTWKFPSGMIIVPASVAFGATPPLSMNFLAVFHEVIGSLQTRASHYAFCRIDFEFSG
jgi:hypothetical protein